MEEPMSTAIDYNLYENRVIEDRIREYYPQVKALIERVITKRLRNQNIPHGLCADFIEEDKKLWQEVIKPWFTPQRFGLTQLDMNNIERYFDGYGEVKRWWLRDLQIWYVFFYEKKGGKVRGVLGKDRTKDLIRGIL